MTVKARRMGAKLPGNSSRRRPSPEPPTTAVGPAASNVEKIARLEAEQLHRRSFFERAGDRAVAIAGRGWVACLHLVWFVGWIAVNTGKVSGLAPFDPYPFNFLTMVVSLEAIFVTLAVLNNQNRMTYLADKRAHLDLQVNLLAEQESTATLRLLQRVARKVGVPPDEVEEAKPLVEETDVADLVTEMDETLPGSVTAPKSAAASTVDSQLTGGKRRG
jgi:uncharacterized membrane protein